jgi:transposase-like protein
MSKDLDPTADAHWRQLLRSFSTSGLSVREFCARHGVSQAHFYARRRQLAAQAGLPAPSSRSQSEPLFVPLRVRHEDAKAPDVVAVSDGRAASGFAEGRIDLLLEGGVTIRLRGSVPPARLAEVLAVLDRRGGHPC